MTDAVNTYTKSDKTKLVLTGITAILTGIPFLVYTAFVVKNFITFCQTPAEPILILITLGLAYLLVFILYFGAIAGCLFGFCAFLVCGIINLTALKGKRTRVIPISVNVVFAFDIVILSVAAIPLFVNLWHLIIYREATALPGCAVVGVPFVLALVNLIINRVFVSGAKRNAR